MFAKAPERRMLTVRIILFGAWATLIVSLFWDPVTVHLTTPDSGSPFRIKDTPVAVQGQILEQKPYAMGARMFWTMVLPLVPLIIMLFGHETWRRICPLSFASRIPYYLGIQWLKKTFNRQTGKLEKKPATFAPDSFLSRYHFPIQFIFLSSGVTARLLFINSDRWVLAAFFIFIISAAILVGLMYGGKTWCNYFCPIAPIQKIYASPRGLLESRAHMPKQPISQSMCRAPGKDGDQSVCVACAAPCPDIDLERSHWETFMQRGTRFTYYGYFGMVFMFYFYYYLYSGSWDYYFSGAWTHEENMQINQLLYPGFFIMGYTINIPKIFAAPLAMTACILASYALWLGIEWIYTRIALKLNPQTTKEDIRHRMLIFSAWATINTFYFFAGAPNVNLMPIWLQRGVYLIIVTVSTLWMARNILRKPSYYTEESLAAALRTRLKQSGNVIREFTRGRPVEELSPAEINLLARVVKSE